MKTDQIRIMTDGTGMKEAVALTEKVGTESNLTSKENLRLRLLSEELFGMISTITGNMEGLYWIEYENKSFDIHLKGEIDLTLEMKDKLVELSTKKENTAAKGFMGKLRDMIGSSLLPRDDGPAPLTMGLMSMGSPAGYHVTGEVYEWSMLQYREEVENSEGEEAEGAKDELEKSIVANIADDVSIRIVKSEVEITISKKF